jgi:hypothetical protein
MALHQLQDEEHRTSQTRVLIVSVACMLGNSDDGQDWVKWEWYQKGQQWKHSSRPV